MKHHRIPAAIAAAIAVLAVGSPAPAHAADPASSSCRAPYLYPPFTRTCETGAVAVTAGHRLTLTTRTCEGSPWRVWDVANHQVIAAGSGSTRIVVNGLFGTYRAKLTDACWKDRISISNA